MLVNNKQMTEFVNSSLPNLFNITIIQTNIDKWSNVVFGDLNYFGLFQCKTKLFPQYSSSSIQIFQVINSQIIQTQSSLYFKSAPIRKAKFINIKIKVFYFVSSNSLSQLQISNSSISQLRLTSITNLKNLQIDASDLKWISLFSLSSIQTLSIKSQSLQTLKLTSINITSFDSISISKLTILELNQIPITEFSTVKLPQIKTLQLDYELFDEPVFNFSSRTLQSLTLIGYKHDFDVSSDTIPRLRSLTIQYSILNKVKTKQLNNLTYLELYNIQSQGQLEIDFHKDIEVIYLIDVNISKMSNHVLDNLLILEIWKTPVEKFQYNSFPQLFYLELIGNQKLQDVRYNNFSYLDFLIVQRNPNIKLNQSFPLLQDILLYNNNPDIIESLQETDNFPSLLTLDIQQNDIENITYLNLPTLRYFDFEGKHIKRIQRNNFPRIKQINVYSDFVHFTDNRIGQNIQQLYFPYAVSLDFNKLMRQFIMMSEQGAIPLRIYLPKNTTQQFKQQVQSVFPNVKVYIGF